MTERLHATLELLLNHGESWNRILRNAKKLIPFLNRKEKKVVEKQKAIDEVNTTPGKLHEKLGGLVKSANLAVFTLRKKYPLLANRVLVHGEGGGVTQAFRD